MPKQYIPFAVTKIEKRYFYKFILPSKSCIYTSFNS